MKTKHCVVCGQGSSRHDWQDIQYPACDSHSKEAVPAAIALLKQQPAKPGPVSVAKPTSASQTPGKTPANTPSIVTQPEAQKENEAEAKSE